jgi:hypothetical protein
MAVPYRWAIRWAPGNPDRVAFGNDEKKRGQQNATECIGGVRWRNAGAV